MIEVQLDVLDVDLHIMNHFQGLACCIILDSKVVLNFACQMMQKFANILAPSRW